MRNGSDDEPEDSNEPLEIPMVGEFSDSTADLHERLLSVPRGGSCILYFDSPGGNPYTAVSLMTLLMIRDIDATGIVSGECSSAALWPFAACKRRLVTPFSVFLFHPMRWQSEENVLIQEATEWARHFAELEQNMDQLLADLLSAPRDLLDQWMRPGRYILGAQIAAAGMAELVDPLTWKLPAADVDGD